MRYLSVAEIAKKWDVSERSVRNYCAQGRVNGAFLTGKTWNIPENAEKPERTNKRKAEPITLLDILKEQAPKDATKEQLQAFLNAQEDKIIEKMAAENKVDAEIEMLGAASAEYTCLVANPTLVVEGDATSAGLSTNMEKRVSMLEEVVADLAAYYPDLKQLGETIAPLKEKVASIQSARAANAEIMGIRDALLK